MFALFRSTLQLARATPYGSSNFFFFFKKRRREKKPKRYLKKICSRYCENPPWCILESFLEVLSLPLNSYFILSQIMLKTNFYSIIKLKFCILKTLPAHPFIVSCLMKDNFIWKNYATLVWNYASDKDYKSLIPAALFRH